MSDPTQAIDAHFKDWINAAIAFVLAVVGWVWHASRLANKIDVLEKEQEELKKTVRRLERQLTYLHGNHGIKTLSEYIEDEDS